LLFSFSNTFSFSLNFLCSLRETLREGLRRELEGDPSDVDGRSECFLLLYSRERLRLEDFSIGLSLSINDLFGSE
jgi:hypothetical protein